MFKNIIAYFFIILLNTSVLIPACISVFEHTNEISLEIDLEEDIEEDIEIKNDLEFKIIPSLNNFFYQLHFINKNKTIFIAKKYSNIFYKIDLPPPDFSL